MQTGPHLGYMRNYFKFWWIEVAATYHPLPADSLPDYNTTFHTLGRNQFELLNNMGLWKDLLRAFDPYPGFTFTADWTFVDQDPVKTWWTIDKANFYRLLGGGIDIATYSFISENWWNVAVSQPQGSQIAQVLDDSPRADGFIDLDGVRVEPS